MIKLFNRLNPIAFFLSYPTPETSGLLTFIDDASNCYKFRTKEVKCPKDKSLIKEIPFFEDN